MTTDFSANSTAAIRFAIQLSALREVELIFLHVNKLWLEPEWIEPEQAKRALIDKAILMERLKSFVSQEYASLNVTEVGYKCDIYYRFGVVASIIDYSLKNHCSYICISTSGAGPVAKLFGTNTGSLIEESRVPVLCIPCNYKVSPLTSILYASDMVNYEQELESIIAFAKPINATINAIHFSPNAIDENIAQKGFPGKPECQVRFFTRERDPKKSLLWEIENVIAEFNPSIVVMVTNQNRSFFELLFLPSKAKEYSFRTTTPLLVYSKGNR